MSIENDVERRRVAHAINCKLEATIKERAWRDKDVINADFDFKDFMKLAGKNLNTVFRDVTTRHYSLYETRDWGVLDHRNRKVWVMIDGVDYAEPMRNSAIKFESGTRRICDMSEYEVIESANIKHYSLFDINLDDQKRLNKSPVLPDTMTKVVDAFESHYRTSNFYMVTYGNKYNRNAICYHTGEYDDVYMDVRAIMYDHWPESYGSQTYVHVDSVVDAFNQYNEPMEIVVEETPEIETSLVDSANITVHEVSECVYTKSIGSLLTQTGECIRSGHNVYHFPTHMAMESEVTSETNTAMLHIPYTVCGNTVLLLDVDTYGSMVALVNINRNVNQLELKDVLLDISCELFSTITNNKVELFVTRSQEELESFSTCLNDPNMDFVKCTYLEEVDIVDVVEEDTVESIYPAHTNGLLDIDYHDTDKSSSARYHNGNMVILPSDKELPVSTDDDTYYKISKCAKWYIGSKSRNILNCNIKCGEIFTVGDALVVVAQHGPYMMAIATADDLSNIPMSDIAGVILGDSTESNDLYLYTLDDSDFTDVYSHILASEDEPHSSALESSVVIEKPLGAWISGGKSIPMFTPPEISFDVNPCDEMHIEEIDLDIVCNVAVSKNAVGILKSNFIIAAIANDGDTSAYHLDESCREFKIPNALVLKLNNNNYITAIDNTVDGTDDVIDDIITSCLSTSGNGKITVAIVPHDTLEGITKHVEMSNTIALQTVSEWNRLSVVMVSGTDTIVDDVTHYNMQLARGLVHKTVESDIVEVDSIIYEGGILVGYQVDGGKYNAIVNEADELPIIVYDTSQKNHMTDIGLAAVCEAIGVDVGERFELIRCFDTYPLMEHYLGTVKLIASSKLSGVEPMVPMTPVSSYGTNDGMFGVTTVMDKNGFNVDKIYEIGSLDDVEDLELDIKSIYSLESGKGFATIDMVKIDGIEDIVLATTMDVDKNLLIYIASANNSVTFNYDVTEELTRSIIKALYKDDYFIAASSPIQKHVALSSSLNYELLAEIYEQCTHESIVIDSVIETIAKHIGNSEDIVAVSVDDKVPEFYINYSEHDVSSNCLCKRNDDTIDMETDGCIGIIIDYNDDVADTERKRLAKEEYGISVFQVRFVMEQGIIKTELVEI